MIVIQEQQGLRDQIILLLPIDITTIKEPLDMDIRGLYHLIIHNNMLVIYL